MPSALRSARSFPLLTLALLMTCSATAHAAHPTDVADAMDEDHPLEVDLEATYTHTRRDLRITRENLQTDPSTGGKGVILVDELKNTRVDDQMNFHLTVGLYHDLELHFDVPLVLGSTQTWGYGEVNGASVQPVSTLDNNHIDISGCAGASNPCDPNGAAKPILPGNGQTKRAGVADPTVGIAWAPIHESREERLPPDIFPTAHTISSWVIGFDYTLPLPGDVDDPSKFGFAAATTPGATTTPTSHSLLRKAHIFSPWTGFSKRFKIMDPYFLLRATLPLVMRGAGVNDGAYDNCWHPENLADVATQNCLLAAWKNQTGYQPSYVGNFTLGTEFVAIETPRSEQKFAVDVHIDATWFSQGRTYSEVTDALGKLTYTDEHAQFTGNLGFYGRAARWLHFRVNGQVGVDTAHFITSEPIGKDLNGDGKILLSAGAATKSQEQNPTYDFRLDQVGRRLRAEATLLWGISGTLSLNF
ncbi:MAG: hypothetical protein JST92_06290 [Deltaproteobacteria bacterium]|nr:hypothetical protein [Deltaproteobacteria bacterium]